MGSAPATSDTVRKPRRMPPPSSCPAWKATDSRLPTALARIRESLVNGMWPGKLIKITNWSRARALQFGDFVVETCYGRWRVRARQPGTHARPAAGGVSSQEDGSGQPGWQRRCTLGSQAWRGFAAAPRPGAPLAIRGHREGAGFRFSGFCRHLRTVVTLQSGEVSVLGVNATRSPRRKLDGMPDRPPDRYARRRGGAPETPYRSSVMPVPDRQR